MAVKQRNEIDPQYTWDFTDIFDADFDNSGEIYKKPLQWEEIKGTIGWKFLKGYGYDRIITENPSHGAKTGTVYRWGV